MSFGVLLSMSLFFTSAGLAQDMSDATSAALELCREEVKDNRIGAAIGGFADALAAAHPIAGSSGLSLFEGPGNSDGIWGPLSRSFTDKLSDLTEGAYPVAMLTNNQNNELSFGVQKDFYDLDIGGLPFSCAAGVTTNFDGDLIPHVGVYTHPYNDSLFGGLTAKEGGIFITIGWSLSE